MIACICGGTIELLALAVGVVATLWAWLKGKLK